MNIVLFSATSKSSVDMLNISALLKERPYYNYTYVLVDNKRKAFKRKFRSFLKGLVLNIIYGENWVSVRRKVDRILLKEVDIDIDKNIKRVLVHDANSEGTAIAIKKLKPDLMIQCGAGILKENIFSIPKLGTINIHHGIAPELRGISSTFWAMYYGMHEYIGVTVHFIDKTIDTGAVILQERTILPENFDYVSAACKTAVLGSKLISKAIDITTSGYTISKSIVRSYYFSSVINVDYLQLRKNNFKPLKDKSEIVFKEKHKMCVLR